MIRLMTVRFPARDVSTCDTLQDDTNFEQSTVGARQTVALSIIHASHVKYYHSLTCLP